MIKVLVFDEQKDLKINPESARVVASETLKHEKRDADELAIYFVDSDEISRLHDEFFDDPSPTDCISFPMDKDRSLGYQILGEVFVCPKTAIDYVQKHEDMSDTPYMETTLYLVHGILHLLGYNDIEEADIKVMRQKEQAIMRHLIERNALLS